MSLQFFLKTPRRKAWLRRVADYRAKDTVSHFASHLKPGETILDIGAGICDISQLLQDKGHVVTPLDIQNLSVIPNLEPVLYDGTVIPFGDKRFDTALLLTVLHHTPDPDALVREAQRVAKRVIIIEDVYVNQTHKRATFLVDSLLNLEFAGHPHTNKTDAEWRQLFARLGLRVAAEKAMKSFLVLRHRMYILEDAV